MHTIEIQIGEHSLKWDVTIEAEPATEYGHPIYLRSYLSRDDFILAKQADIHSTGPHPFTLTVGHKSFQLKGEPTFTNDRGLYRYADMRVYTDAEQWRAIREADVQCDLAED